MLNEALHGRQTHSFYLFIYVIFIFILLRNKKTSQNLARIGGWSSIMGCPQLTPTTIDLSGSVFPFLLFLFFFISIEVNVSFKCGGGISHLNSLVFNFRVDKICAFALLFDSFAS